MKVTNNTVVTLHYTVSTEDGTEIDSSQGGEPMVVLQGSHYLIKGLEDALLNKQPGDKFKLDVAPELAYGERHEQLVQSVPQSMFEGVEVKVGMSFRATTDDGEQSVIVIDIDEENVVVDGNHPLAGLPLNFDVEVLDVRDATEAEIAEGKVQSASCCGSSDCTHH